MQHTELGWSNIIGIITYKGKVGFYPLHRSVNSLPGSSRSCWPGSPRLTAFASCIHAPSSRVIECRVKIAGDDLLVALFWHRHRHKQTVFYISLNDIKE